MLPWTSLSGPAVGTPATGAEESWIFARKSCGLAQMKGSRSGWGTLAVNQHGFAEDATVAESALEATFQQ